MKKAVHAAGVVSMRGYASAIRLAATLGILVLAACAERSPTAPSSGPDARSGSPPSAIASDSGPDDPNVFGSAVPGFGGFFFDSAGAPTAYLKDPGRRAELERVLLPFLRREGTSLRVLEAEFDLVQLERWFAEVVPTVLGVSGTVFADLDEASNRLRIGVAQPAAIPAVTRWIATLGVPASAVILEPTTPILPVATLQDGIRPVVGGLEISYTGGWRCTLGFNAIVSGVSSFVTASHCSIRYGSSDGTNYNQPDGSLTGSLLGTEVSDPSFFTGGACPVGRRCRYSDATRAAYAAGVPFTLGSIARPSGVNDGSLTVAGSFSIVRERNGLVGNTVNKVGRTTGWSRGRMTRTCVTTNVHATNVTLLCQHWVSAAVAGGDSGAPVFLEVGAGKVSLSGVLWGGDAAGKTFIFSPISSIERELGSLQTS